MGAGSHENNFPEMLPRALPRGKVRTKGARLWEAFGPAAAIVRLGMIVPPIRYNINAI
jgi:hypothetical protein